MIRLNADLVMNANTVLSKGTSKYSIATNGRIIRMNYNPRSGSYNDSHLPEIDFGEFGVIWIDGNARNVTGSPYYVTLNVRLKADYLTIYDQVNDSGGSYSIFFIDLMLMLHHCQL